MVLCSARIEAQDPGIQQTCARTAKVVPRLPKRRSNIPCSTNVPPSMRFQTCCPAVRRSLSVKNGQFFPIRRALSSDSSAVSAGKAMTIGGTAGIFGSLVGLGGGFVAIPALIGWVRLTQHQAHATSLGAVLATGLAGSTAYALADQVDYEAALGMAVGGMVGARWGARATASMSPNALKMALGLLMICVAPLLPLKDQLLSRKENIEGLVITSEIDGGGKGSSAGKPDAYVVARQEQNQEMSKGAQREGHPGQSELASTIAHVGKMSCIGLGSGLLAGMFGIGGGVLTVPAISYSTDLGHKEVLGTSLAAMVLPACVGAVTHFQQGNLRPAVAVPLAVGTSLGAFLGANFATRHVDEVALKWAFSGAMLLLGGRTFMAALRHASATGTRAHLKGSTNTPPARMLGTKVGSEVGRKN
ncbi:unnamed protein product [Discosporangium mesarthrocarpum]